MEDKNGKATACNKTTKHLQTSPNIVAKACGSAINKNQKPYYRGGFVAAEAFEALLQEAPYQERFFYNKTCRLRQAWLPTCRKGGGRRAERVVAVVLKVWFPNAIRNTC